MQAQKLPIICACVAARTKRQLRKAWARVREIVEIIRFS